MRWARATPAAAPGRWAAAGHRARCWRCWWCGRLRGGGARSCPCARVPARQAQGCRLRGALPSTHPPPTQRARAPTCAPQRVVRRLPHHQQQQPRHINLRGRRHARARCEHRAQRGRHARGAHRRQARNERVVGRAVGARQRVRGRQQARGGAQGRGRHAALLVQQPVAQRAPAARRLRREACAQGRLGVGCVGGSARAAPRSWGETLRAGHDAHTPLLPALPPLLPGRRYHLRC